MAIFKSEEEKAKELREKIKEAENKMLKNRTFLGKIGATHTGWTFNDGLRNADRIKFNPTVFTIHDTEIIIERDKSIIYISQIKQILQERPNEALIMLNNGTIRVIRSRNNSLSKSAEYRAFMNILNKLFEDSKKNTDSIKLNVNNNENINGLIKLGEMYDKGLLTDEEFTTMKQKFISGDNEIINGNKDPKNEDTSPNFCGNCGSKLVENSKFCAECGTKIK